MVWDGFNRRRFPRLKRKCEIYIYPGTSRKPIVTYTENVGAGGICVFLSRELERFSSCRVRLKLDRRIPVIDCKGRVIWAIKTKAPKKKSRYDTGIEFMNLKEELHQKVHDYVEAHMAEEAEALPER